jgi:hypothetical protein
MDKFFILATKRVELRGFIRAENLESANQKVRDYWQIYDTSHNTITVGTAEPGGEVPIISEFDEMIKILHIEDDTGCKHPKGIKLTKMQREGKWRDTS